MELHEEMAAEADRIRALRALRPHIQRSDIPRCRKCHKGLQVRDLGEDDCEGCREKASNRMMLAEGRRHVKRDDLVVDW